MPLLELKCRQCGHSYEALKSWSTADPSLSACPQCGSGDLETLPSGCGAIRGDRRDLRMEDIDPLEAEMHLENRRYIEANSEKVLSGELSIKEQGPEWSRPRLPDHLKRKYY